MISAPVIKALKNERQVCEFPMSWNCKQWHVAVHWHLKGRWHVVRITEALEGTWANRQDDQGNYQSNVGY